MERRVSRPPTTLTSPDDVCMRISKHCSRPICRICFTRRDAVRRRKPAAACHAAAQLWHDLVDSLHDLEGPVCRHRLVVPHCRRPLGLHGAGVPARRPPSAMEPQLVPGVGRWRGCCVQRGWQGHSDCPPDCAQVWDWSHGETAHQGRQQRSRRHGPVRPQAGLPRAEGHCGQRGGVCAVCRLRHDHADGTPVAEDGDAGHYGLGGGPAEGVGRTRRRTRRSRQTTHERENMYHANGMGLGGLCGAF